MHNWIDIGMAKFWGLLLPAQLQELPNVVTFSVIRSFDAVLRFAFSLILAPFALMGHVFGK